MKLSVQKYDRDGEITERTASCMNQYCKYYMLMQLLK